MEIIHHIYDNKNTVSCSSRNPPEKRHIHSIRRIFTTKKKHINDITNEILDVLYPSATNKTRNENIKKNHIIVKSKKNEWNIRVPLEHHGEIVNVRLLGDVGADTCGINEELAEVEFGDQIQRTHKPLYIETPGGIVQTHKFVNLSFKRQDGTIWTTRFHLIPDLPTPLLADKNLLEAFGYEFPDGTPPAFQLRHDEENEFDLDLEMKDTFTPITDNYDPQKVNQMYLALKQSNQQNINENTTMTTRVFTNGKTIYDYTHNGKDSITMNYMAMKHIKSEIANNKILNFHKNNQRNMNHISVSIKEMEQKEIESKFIPTQKQIEKDTARIYGMSVNQSITTTKTNSAQKPITKNNTKHKFDKLTKTQKRIQRNKSTFLSKGINELIGKRELT